MQQGFFAAEAQHAVDSIGSATVRRVEMSHLKLAQPTDSHHLDSTQNQDAGERK